MNVDDHFQYLVLGGGVAGGRAVELLARSKHPTALVSAEPVQPYSRPPLSKSLLRGEKSLSDIALRSLHFYQDKNIKLLLGDPGVHLDVATQRVRLGSGKILSYEKLLLAPGAEPVKLPVPGAQLDGVHYFRTLDDAHRLKGQVSSAIDSEVVIIGGGFVGCEIASTLRASGRRIHLVEATDGLMVRALGRDVGQLMAERHREAGVNLHLGVQVSRINGEGRAQSVVLSNGVELACDAVVVGIGAVPTVSWLESSGLELSDGIVVDQYAKASAANIFAAGDAARFWSPSMQRHIRLEHESNALNQAVIAARNILGGSVIHDPIPYVWSEQYDLDIWCLGVLEGHDDVDLVVDTDRWQIVAVYYRDSTPTAALGVNAPDVLARARQMFQTRTRFTANDLAAEQHSA
ncbi:FAD-dependent oxidoreductase [Nocardia sp. R6R-6]|uniref:FAD-dependent oxidoreductase n=1 Tax=Nocardia sp. R6R-6 TaxID=3459303 RepID=UPI00403DAE49